MKTSALKNILKKIIVILFAVILSSNILYEPIVYAQGDSENLQETEAGVYPQETGNNQEVGKVQDASLVLNYLAIQNSEVKTPGTLNIAASIGNDNSNIDTAELYAINQETQEEIVVSAEEIQGDAIRFSRDFVEESLEGTYIVSGIAYTVDGVQYYLSMEETGIEAKFGVNTEVETDPDSYAIEDNATSFSAYDSEGNIIDEGEIAKAIEQAQLQAGANANEIKSERARSGNLVVVLDPGHDSTHAGAHQNGLKEEELTLKIAQYCKEELETYAGVTVYMTRTTEACPYPGTTSTNCNKQRVAYADSVDCDIYVSIHLNSSESASANGVEVYYPNANYNAAVGAEGKGVAEKVLNELVALGLANRGVKLNDDDGFFYPDGSVADDHTVINNNKLNGIPAILIEHAFLSNASDVNNFLRTEEQLRELGRADARGIAAYYQLGKDEGEELYSANVSIENVNTVSGTFDITISDIVSTRGIQSILVPVWSQSDQSDLVWYTAERQSNGTYKVHVDVAGHNCNYGVYQVHTYIVNRYGVYNGVSAMSVDLPKSKAKVGVVSNSSWEYKATAWHVPGTLGNSLAQVQFAVWSADNGQDDLVWYAGAKIGDTYTTTIPLINHSGSGTYYIHTYATYSNGKQECVDESTFSVSRKNVSVAITNVNTVSGTFDITVSNVTAKSVDVPVWSQSDQSDIRWYDAEKQTDGTYKVHVDIANHNCNYGTYQIHTYVRENSGAYNCVNTTSLNMQKPETIVDTNLSANDLECEATAWHIPGTLGSSLKQVQFAVWSANGGQDDLVWYQGSLKGDKYVCDINLRNHGTTGIYYVHVYGTWSNGKQELVSTTSFYVKNNNATTTIKNLNTVTGSFDVVVSNVYGFGGVSEVLVPVWSKTDQSNIIWYKASRGSDGTYSVHVDAANHGCDFGTYQIHTYVKGKIGDNLLVNTNSVDFSETEPVVTIEPNDSGTVYTINAWHIPGTLGASLKKVKMAVWSEEGGQDDLRWYDAYLEGDKYLVNVLISNHNTAGRYIVHVYADYANGDERGVAIANFDANNLYPICGKSAVSLEELVDYYTRNAVYPEFYATTDAPNIATFCRIYLEECEDEGIRAEVAFCQAMKETGFLKFGGDVSITQFNFAGLGATGSDHGNSYSNVREGIRAQIQHLKAYASREELNNDCVDNRFQYVVRGSAPYVEWLGLHENPNGTGWATEVGYGKSIRNDYMNKLLFNL